MSQLRQPLLHRIVEAEASALYQRKAATARIGFVIDWMRTIASGARSPAATTVTCPSAEPMTPMIPGAVPRET